MTIALKTQIGTTFNVVNQEQLQELAVLALSEALDIGKQSGANAVKLTLEKVAVIAEALKVRNAPDIARAFTDVTVKNRRGIVDRVNAILAYEFLTPKK